MKMILAHIWGMCLVNDNKMCISKEAFHSIKDHTFEKPYTVLYNHI